MKRLWVGELDGRKIRQVVDDHDVAAVGDDAWDRIGHLFELLGVDEDTPVQEFFANVRNVPLPR